MTEEEKKKFDEMQRQIEELLEWKRTREQQQISYPLDDTSKQIIAEL